MTNVFCAFSESDFDCQLVIHHTTSRCAHRASPTQTMPPYSLAFASSAFATGHVSVSRTVRRCGRGASRGYRAGISRTTRTIVAANDGRKSLFVKVTVKDGQMDAYKEIIQRHISNCFAKDRCMYFDYGVSDDPNVVMLYETYEGSPPVHSPPAT